MLSSAGDLHAKEPFLRSSDCLKSNAKWPHVTYNMLSLRSLTNDLNCLRLMQAHRKNRTGLTVLMLLRY